jgi:GNAT superfamily N-acetyltransferase
VGPVRHKMRLALTPQDVAPRWPVRTIARGDAEALGALMYAAYHGTIDDEGETPEESVAEMRRTLEGQYGPPLQSCSFLIEQEGRALAATVITWWREAPLLAFVMSRPEAQGRGLATDLIKRSINALLAEGHTELLLAVTEGNAPAQHLYEKLGFRIVP